MKYADVILPLPLENSYTYSIPSDLEQAVIPGCRVIVHFGKKLYYTAIVMDVHERFVAVLYQTFEGQGQAVTGNGLRDVFDELAAVGRCVYPVRAHLRFVVYRRPSELVFPDVRLRIEKPAAAWQCNRQVVIAV